MTYTLVHWFNALGFGVHELHRDNCDQRVLVHNTESPEGSNLFPMGSIYSTYPLKDDDWTSDKWRIKRDQLS